MHIASQLTWPQMQTLAQRSALALLPVGSTEAHGPHLPLGVDVLIAEAVCESVAETLMKSSRRASVRFPAVAYGLTDFAAAFSGTISLSAEATRGLLEGVLRGIISHGFREVAVVNHHLEPAHFAVVHDAARAVAAETGARIVVPDHRKKPHNAALGDEFTTGGSHAGTYETSLMLAVAPQLVREDIRRSLPALDINLPAVIKAGARDFAACGGPDAYFGRPASASREEGERLLGALTQICIEALKASL